MAPKDIAAPSPSGTGFCATHGEGTTVLDSRGRPRCGVPTCRQLVSRAGKVKAGGLRQDSGPGLSPLDEDPDIREHRKKLEIAKLDRELREVSGPTELERQVVELYEKLETRTGPQSEIRRTLAKLEEGLNSEDALLQDVEAELKDLKVRVDRVKQEVERALDSAAKRVSQLERALPYMRSLERIVLSRVDRSRIG